MSDMFIGSQAPLYQNVCITRRSKNGKILEQRFAKNRVTRLMLYGIGKFLLGHFNNSTPDKIYEFIPRYLALGTNTPGVDYQSVNVSTLSSVNDTRLLNEITKSSTVGTEESVKRIWIAERNMCKINTKFSDPYIKISIKTYVSSNHYDNMSIGEAGLFSKEKDNNCLARVCFSPITKNPGEVLDIQWDITLLSYGETKYPDKLEIDNGSKVTVPLKYTNRYFKECDLGLKRYFAYNSIGVDNCKDLFIINSNGTISTEYSKDDIIYNSGWKSYLDTINLGDHIELFIDELLNAQLNDNSNDGQFAKYFISKHQQTPTLFHFGNLYINEETEILDNDSVCATLLFTEDKELEYTDTKAKYKATNKSGEYIITVNGSKEEYKVVNNQFYKKSVNNISNWEETQYYMYNGVIVTNEGIETEYAYNEGKFYKVTTTIKNIFTRQYLNYSNSTDEQLFMFKIGSYNTIQNTGYTLRIEDNYKIYLNNEYTTYHLSNDNYWVVGDYVKLIPILTPKDCTDKSITWNIQNNDVAKINFNGVVTAWNIGETTAIASTTNDLRAKCIIDVVKETNYIDIDEITIDPTEVTLIVDGDANQYIDITATVYPLFATNSSVTWKVSSEISNAISIINLGNNALRIVLSGTGNIGIGTISAVSQSGKSASCLVKVLYASNNDECDCPDESHLLQKG